MHYQDIIESMQGREVIYAYFSDVYLFLADEKHIKLLKEILPALKEILSDITSEDLLLSIKQLETYTEKYFSEPNKEDKLETLNRAYTRLYCLGKGVSLSESVYVSPIHLTRQESDIEVGRIYNKCKFDMKHTSNEPEDHISYELMFMSYLSKGISQHLLKENMEEASKLLNLQKEFLNNHLLVWIDGICKMTGKYEESLEYYYPLTILLKSYLKEDEKYLETLEF